MNKISAINLRLLLLSTILGCGVTTDRTIFERSETGTVEVRIENPRKKGEHYFIVEDGIVFEREGPDDKEIYDYNSLVMVFIRFENESSFVLPRFEMTQGRKTASQGIVQEWVSFTPQQWVSSPIRNKVRVPRSSEIAEYLFAIKSEVEDTGWRYLNIRGKDLDRTAKVISVPDILSLPRLEARPDYKKLRLAVGRHQGVEELPGE